MSKGYDKLLEEDSKSDPSRPFVAPLAWGLLACLIALLVGIARQVFAEPITPAIEGFTGTAIIIDGDTIDVGQHRIRLYGIDTAEAGQKCKKPNGGSWRCGQAAIDTLVRLTQNKQVRCKGDKWDDFGRLIATCSVGSLELNHELVRLGLAWNFDKYSMTYKPLENRARKSRIGVFQAPTQTPWDYRAQRWKVAVQQAPKGCPIKGNISGSKRIYHAPWSPWYKRTKVSLDKGERWFCSEAAAIKAGWRAPYWH